MATALVVIFVTVLSFVSARNNDCEHYRDGTGFHESQSCYGSSFCCGTCTRRYCCSTYMYRLSEDDQDECPVFGFDDIPSPVIIGSSIAGIVTLVLLFICCCVCPCCCLYKMCRKPTPVIATTTHHTTVTTQYPQQPSASPGQAYQGAQYPGYNPVPVQPGYGAQPMQPGYGAQPMQPGYGGQPGPSAPYHGQPYMPGPPPPYQEAAGYASAPMPYSQAAFSPGHSAYPLQPPGHPPPQTDSQSGQPAYNPAYVEAPPPKTGY